METIKHDLSANELLTGSDVNEIFKNIDTNIQDVDTKVSNSGIFLSYVAVLEQNTVYTVGGQLVVGQTYNIRALLGDDDFSNVGFTEVNSQFVATATTPTKWLNSTKVYNLLLSSPVPTIIHNSIGNIVWSSSAALGYHNGYLYGAFLEGRVYACAHYIERPGLNTPVMLSLSRIANHAVALAVLDTVTGLPTDLNGSIYVEIRVYFPNL
jgi:hypothetical protein